MKISRAVAIAAAVPVLAVAAQTVASAAPASVSPAQRTCSAVRTWDHHKTTKNLDAMMATSVTAPWHPLGLDVVVLYTDVKEGDHLDQRADIQALGQDCR